MACELCNRAKGVQTAEEFGYPDVQRQAKAPLKDAAAVNTTRWALYQRLSATGLPMEVGTGGRTKWNRTQRGLPKAHWLDAACVGASTPPLLRTREVPRGRSRRRDMATGSCVARTAMAFPSVIAPATNASAAFRRETWCGRSSRRGRRRASTGDGSLCGPQAPLTFARALGGRRALTPVIVGRSTAMMAIPIALALARSRESWRRLRRLSALPRTRERLILPLPEGAELPQAESCDVCPSRVAPACVRSLSTMPVVNASHGPHNVVMWRQTALPFPAVGN